MVPAEGGVPREVVSTGIIQLYSFRPALAWSHDSQWIAYAGADGNTGLESIYAVAPGSGIVHKLTESKPGEAHKEPALSGDGKLLAFIVDRDGISNLSLRKASRRDDARRRGAGVAILSAGKHHLPRSRLACRYR